MELILINRIVVILIDVIAISLGLWFFLINRKNRINQTFFLGIIFAVFWITFTFLSNSAKNAELALAWRRKSWGAIPFLLLSVYFFSIYFPRESKRPRILDAFVIFVCLLVSYFAIFTDLILKDAKIERWGAEIIFGKGAIYFYLAVVALLIFALFQPWKKYLISSPAEKLKIKYILIGISLTGFFNVIFNVAFPIIRKSKEFYQFGDYSVIFFLGFTAYAIIKKELFEIKVVLTDLLVVTLGIILLILPFLMADLEMIILTGIIFLAYCPIGYLLTKSVRREIKMREILEEKVRERTKEIEEKTKQLEEARATLEIRVRARTKELEELAQSLENQVEERTKELKQRVNELEKFHKIAVGRELKMVELKKRIKELEDELRFLRKKE